MKNLSFILIILSVFAVEIFAKSWNGITPGVSTRLEVEKILNKDLPKFELARYRLKKFTVYIFYDKKGDNFSDKDVVVRIDVYPDNRKQLLSSYIKKIPNFHEDFVKEEIPDETSHIHGEAYYRNLTEGFEIHVQRGTKTEREFITGFGYYAPYHGKPQEESEKSALVKVC